MTRCLLKTSQPCLFCTIWPWQTATMINWTGCTMVSQDTKVSKKLMDALLLQGTSTMGSDSEETAIEVRKPSYSRGRRDHGYAWVVVLLVMVSQVIQYGVVWTVGVFYVIFLENVKNNGAAEVALISSLNTAMSYGIGSYSPRKRCCTLRMPRQRIASYIFSRLGFRINAYQWYKPVKNFCF